ncbi:hypothetical protein LJB90_02665 [Eubacteriales bacterium OttesenSCG-928-G02]|nr:hypothetical protein [Eubacteriales bacterium OttesenSCG-928-G02]
MRCNQKLIGGCALAFGAGVLLSCFLPASVMVCITAAVITAAGVLLVFT